MEDITLLGEVDENGNLMITNKSMMKKALSTIKGKKVVMTISLISKDPSKEMIGYFFKVVVPAYQAIFKECGDVLTLEQTELRLRQISPRTIKEKKWGGVNVGYNVEVLESVYSLNSKQMIEHIDYLITLAATEFSYVIESPIKKG